MHGRLDLQKQLTLLNRSVMRMLHVITQKRQHIIIIMHVAILIGKTSIEMALFEQTAAACDEGKTNWVSKLER